LGDRPISRAVDLQAFLHFSNLAVASPRYDSSLAVGDRRTQINQDRIRFENTSGLAEGMDHAPSVQSSE
jgi:hypothetical protein